jgi:hypothetical protein
MSFATRWMIGCITIAVVSAVLGAVLATVGNTTDTAVSCVVGLVALVGCYHTPRETRVNR